MHHRSLSVVPATLAALALGSAPALAGEDDDSGDGDTAVPVQVQQAPAAPSSGAVPQGGVATGLGGSAPRDHDGLLLGLGTGVLLLAGAGGGLVAVRRGAS